MMPPGMEIEKLNIEQVGEPGQGVPVTGIERSEGPVDCVEGEPLCEGGVTGYVLVIIQIDEIEGYQLPVNEGDDEKQSSQPESESNLVRGRLPTDILTIDHGVFAFST